MKREGDLKGTAIVRASWAGTVAFGVGAVLGVVAPDQLQWLGFAVSLASFIAGCVVFVWSFVLAAGRSRTDEIAVANLYLMTGAPGAVRAQLFGSLAVEIVVAFGTAAARPYTIAATAILAPVYGLSLCGLWSARYGTFPRRKPARKRK